MSLRRRIRPQDPRPTPVARVGGRRNYGLTPSAIRPAVLLLAKAIFIPLASAAPLHPFWPGHGLLSTLEEDTPDAADPNLWLYLAVAMVLVLLGGVFAGLTIALMGQDETYLQVIATSGEGSERRHAEKVLALLNKGKHWVLVTLLLSNVITNETLPIVLDRSLGGGWPAVLGSTVLIVIFGEIAPQSVCVRYGLSIGAFMAPFVLGLMWVMFPIAWPTAKLLDWLLGEDHGTTYKKAGLKTLVSLHKTLGSTPGERLMEDEVTIINSVLDLKDKSVGSIMTPMGDVFTMSADTVLDETMMDTILTQGYSRIPIYAPDNSSNFLGMLLVKILITYDPEDAKRVRDFSLATLPETSEYTSCLDIINFFQEGKSHMVLVSDFPGQDQGALGVVTLEDVIEELIGEEIVDESDVFIDVHKAIRRMAPAPRQRFLRHSSSRQAMIVDGDHNQSAEHGGEDEPLLSKETTSSRKPSLTTGMPGTVLMRRKSSQASEHPVASRGMPVRSNTVDMREHLRHLGPSNAANKPRTTKFSNVKIKPGVGTIPENHTTTKGLTVPETVNGSNPSNGLVLQRSRSVDGASDGAPGDESSLLRSAGRDASDAVVHLPKTYGTMSSSPQSPERKRGASSDRMNAQEASDLAEQKATPQKSSSGDQRTDEHLKVPSKTVVGDGTTADEAGDLLGDMGPPSRERSTRRQARSGSITETTLDVGGMKKLVLETTSSSSDEEGKEDSGQNSPGKRKKKGKKGSGSSKDS